MLRLNLIVLPLLTVYSKKCIEPLTLLALGGGGESTQRFLKQQLLEKSSP